MVERSQIATLPSPFITIDLLDLSRALIDFVSLLLHKREIAKTVRNSMQFIGVLLWLLIILALELHKGSVSASLLKQDTKIIL